jgi:hypothetical protein
MEASMKNSLFITIWIIIVSLVPASLIAETTIIEAEYFFNNDPGEGNGTYLNTDNNTFQKNTTIPNLPYGNNTIYVRAKDSLGRWGKAYPRNFTVVEKLPPIQNTYDMSVIAAEYFIDNDPGQGNGIAIQSTDGSFNDKIENFSIDNIAVNQLSLGNHTLFVRGKSQLGIWGPTKKVQFTRVEKNPPIQNEYQMSIFAAEYFIDTDPGQGNGTPLNAQDGNFDSKIENFSINNIPVNQVSLGNHTLFVRGKSQLGIWGPTKKIQFKKVEKNPPIQNEYHMSIIAAEYFIDTDPGQGNGTPLNAQDGNFDSKIEKFAISDIAVSHFPLGRHTVFVRGKNQLNIWGPTKQYTFVQIEKHPPTQETYQMTITDAEYFIDTDPGEGNGIPVLATDGSFDGKIESFSLSEIAVNHLIPGNHTLFVRGKDNFGRWGKPKAFQFHIDPVAGSADDYYIIAAEYYIDTDPGKGKGIPIKSTDGSMDSIYEQFSMDAIDISYLSPGNHRLYVRGKRNDGVWGAVYARTFYVPENLPPFHSDCAVLIGGAVYNTVDKKYVSNIPLKLIQNGVQIKYSATNADGRYSFCINEIQNNTYELRPDSPSENNLFVFTPSSRVVHSNTSYSGYHFQAVPKATEWNFSLAFISPASTNELKENESFIVRFNTVNLPPEAVIESAKLVSVRSSDQQKVNSTVHIDNNIGAAEMLLNAGNYALIATVKAHYAGKTLEKTIEKQVVVIKASSDPQKIDFSEMLSCKISGKDLSYSADDIIYTDDIDSLSCQLKLDNGFSLFPETIQLYFRGENVEYIKQDLTQVDNSSNYQAPVDFTGNYSSRTWLLAWDFSTKEIFARGFFKNSIIPRDKALQVTVTSDTEEIPWNPFSLRDDEITFTAKVLDQDNAPITDGLSVRCYPGSEVSDIMLDGNVGAKLISSSEGRYRLTAQPVSTTSILAYDSFEAKLYFKKAGYIPAYSQNFTILVRPITLSEFEVIDQFINHVRNTNKAMFNTIDSQLIPIMGELSHRLAENDFRIVPDGKIGLTFKMLTLASTCVGDSIKINNHMIKLAKKLFDNSTGYVGKIDTGLSVMKAIDRTFYSGLYRYDGNLDEFIRKELEPKANNVLDNAISALKELLYKVSAKYPNYAFTEGQTASIEECVQRLTGIRSTLIWEVNWLHNQIVFGLLDESRLSIYALAPDAIDYLAGLISKVPGGQFYGCAAAGTGMVVNDFVDQFHDDQEKELRYLYDLTKTFLEVKTVEIFTEMTDLIDEMFNIILDKNTCARLADIQMIPERTQAVYDESFLGNILTNVQTPIKAINTSDETIQVSLDMCRFHAVRPKKMFDILGYDVNNYLVFNDKINFSENSDFYYNTKPVYDQDVFWVTHYATQDLFGEVPPQLINIDLKEDNGKKYIHAVMDFAVTFADGLKLSYPETFHVNFTEAPDNERRSLQNTLPNTKPPIHINSELRRMGHQIILLHHLTNLKGHPINMTWMQTFPQGAQLIGDESMTLSENSLSGINVLSAEKTYVVEMIVAPGAYTDNVTIPSFSVNDGDGNVIQSRPLKIPDKWLIPLMITIDTPEIIYAETFETITVNISNSSSETQYLDVSVSTYPESMAISETRTLTIDPLDKTEARFSFKTNNKQSDHEIFHIQVNHISDDMALFQRDIKIETFYDTDQDMMEDDWELSHNLDITIDDSEEDTDADGLSNLIEYQKGTDPNNPDTDDDGLSDGQEINIHNTDPLLADTDNGGEKDGSEISAFRNPLDIDDDALSLIVIPNQSTVHPNLLSVYWFASSHDQLNYKIALGTLEGMDNIHAWEDIGQLNSFSFENLTLTKSEYFIQIEALKNGESKGKFVKKWTTENNQWGDLDGNGVVDISDAIRSLKINSALPITNAFFENSDINGDNKFSLVESIFIMQMISTK